MVMAAEISSEPRQPNRFEKRKTTRTFLSQDEKARNDYSFRTKRRFGAADNEAHGGLEPWPTPGNG
jgi:hypothetical protein